MAPPRSQSTAKKRLVAPEDLLAELKKNRQAQTAFESFSHSHPREYVQRISEARRGKTRTPTSGHP